MPRHSTFTLLAAGLAAFLAAANSSAFAASSYTVKNLISDIPNPTGSTDPNLIVDPNLVDPWGIAISATSPFWISNAGTGTATVYSWSATATPSITVSTTVVKVPDANGGAGRVTGQIANSTGGFALNPGQVPNFLFCTEDGTLSGWNRTTNPTNAVVKINNNGAAVYKGCAAAVTVNGPRLYAANFYSGGIDVFDSNWNPTSTGGGFIDPNLPAGLSPFNIQVFGKKLYVTYAMTSNGLRDIAGPGNGQVDVFDFDGNLLQTISSPVMNSPWGLEIAPEFFGDFSTALLVGNFGDGTINAFDALTGAYLGTMSDAKGIPITLEGLWGLQFGNGRSGGDAKTLYFTAGISGGSGRESHGLFGAITTP